MKNIILTLMNFIVFMVLSTIYVFSTPIEQLYEIDETASSTRPYYTFPNEEGGQLLVGVIFDKQIAFEYAASGIFVLNLIPDENNPDSLIVDYYSKFYPSDTTSILTISYCYQKDNGNTVIICPYFYIQPYLNFVSYMCECVYIIEFDNRGNLVYSFVDLSWLPANGGTPAEQSVPLMGGPYTNILFQDKSVGIIHHYDGNETAHPNDTLAKYELLVRVYDSLGKFMYLKPIRGLDTTKLYDTVGSNYKMSYIAKWGNNGEYLAYVTKIYYLPGKPPKPPYQYEEIPINYVIKLTKDFEVIWQKETNEVFPPIQNTYQGKKTIDNARIINKDGDYIVFRKITDLNPDEERNENIINNYISIFDTSDFSLKCRYSFHETIYPIKLPIQTSKGDYLFAGYENINWYDPIFNIAEGANYAAYILSKDFQTFKVYANPDKIKYTDVLTIPIERADGKYEFWGYMDGNGLEDAPAYLLRLILDEEDFIDRELKVGISEDQLKLRNLISNSQIFPNPTSNKLSIDNGENIINKIEIYSLSGNLLSSYQVENTNITLDVSNLSTGIYFLDIDGKTFQFIKE